MTRGAAGIGEPGEPVEVPFRGLRRNAFALAGGLILLLGIIFLVSKLAGFYHVPGLASIAVFVAFLGGIQLLLIGIMGEYIARIHDEVKGRPLYLVSETHGLEPRQPA